VMDPVRLTCRTHGHVGTTETIAPTLALRGVAKVWRCHICAAPILLWAEPDWQERFGAAYPDRLQPVTTFETSTDPDGWLRTVTTTRHPPLPEDWTDADQEVLAALAVGSVQNRR
jgi:hypothetical protein